MTSRINIPDLKGSQQGRLDGDVPREHDGANDGRYKEPVKAILPISFNWWRLCQGKNYPSFLIA